MANLRHLENSCGSRRSGSDEHTRFNISRKTRRIKKISTLFLQTFGHAIKRTDTRVKFFRKNPLPMYLLGEIFDHFFLSNGEERNVFLRKKFVTSGLRCEQQASMKRIITLWRSEGRERWTRGQVGAVNKSDTHRLRHRTLKQITDS